MAKGGFRGMPGMGGGMGGANLNQLMKQAQKMQQDMERVQEEIQSMTEEATAGGGVVKVVVNGNHEIVSLTIDPAAVDPEDVEMLQDLIIAACNEASRKIEETADAKKSQIAGGARLPF